MSGFRIVPVSADCAAHLPGLRDFIAQKRSHHYLHDPLFVRCVDGAPHVVSELGIFMRTRGKVYAAVGDNGNVMGFIGFAPCPFDTAHFGYPVAAVDWFDVAAPESVDEEAVAACLLASFFGWARKEGIRFAFAKTRAGSSSALAVALEREGFYLIDTTLRLSKELSKESLEKSREPSIKEAEPADYAAIMGISKISPWTSRFFLDPRIASGPAHAFYRQWLSRGIEERKRFTVIHVGDKVRGFVLWSTKSMYVPFSDASTLVAHWELSAVDSRFLGRGLGAILYGGALDEMQRAGVRLVWQGVSAHNSRALNLCARLGFSFNYCDVVHHRFFD